MMPALSCQTMAANQESKIDTNSSSTTSSYNAYKTAAAAAASAASIRNPSVLVSWILEHKSSPYPTKDEKKLLAKQAGMTITQVSYWFANTRRRIKKLGSWMVWEESQVHHKTPVVLPASLSLFQYPDPFSTNTILAGDQSRTNHTNSLYQPGHPSYPYTYATGSFGSTGFHGFGAAGTAYGSTSSSPLLTPSPHMDSSVFSLPPKTASACMSSPLLATMPNTPSYSPNFQGFQNMCITPTSIGPMQPSIVTSSSGYKPSLYQVPATAAGTTYSNGISPYISIPPCST